MTASPPWSQPSTRRRTGVLAHSGRRTVVDGTGRPGFRADVCVLDDRIVALGDLSGAEAAERLGLAGKGRDGPGFDADLVVYDPATVADRASFQDPHYYPSGLPHVIVGGVLTVRDGRHTGALAGPVLRRRQ